MAAVEIIDDGDGGFSLKGELTFDTVSDLLDRGQHVFSEHSKIVLDLQGIERTDSAGLALLIEWVNWANHSVREISYEHVPERLINIAKISEVESLLVAGERWSGFL